MSDPNMPAYAVFAAAVGIGGFVVYGLVRAGTGRRDRIREGYANEILPQYVRNMVPILPVLSLAGLCWAAIAAIGSVEPDDPPRSVLLALFIASALLMQVSLIVAYRVPAPFLPPWLRAEIDAGITPVARPDRGEWILFAMFSTLFTGGSLLMILVALPPL